MCVQVSVWPPCRSKDTGNQNAGAQTGPWISLMAKQLLVGNVSQIFSSGHADTRYGDEGFPLVSSASHHYEA